MAPWALILRVFAFVLFVIAVFVLLAVAKDWEAALVPGGLACWVLSELVGPVRAAVA